MPRSNNAFPFVMGGEVPGMTRREYYAAHAPMTFDDACGVALGVSVAHLDMGSEDYAKTLRYLVKMRYDYADEMVKREEQ